MKKNGNVKLSFGDFEPRFFINKENGTVVCKLDCELRLPMLQLPYIEDDAPYRYNFTKYIKATGIATCSKDDVFDENRGKRIALARAENDAYNFSKKYLKDYQRFVVNLNDSINYFYDKATRANAHNREYVKGLSDKNNPNYKEVILPPVIKGKPKPF